MKYSSFKGGVHEHFSTSKIKSFGQGTTLISPVSGHFLTIFNFKGGGVHEKCLAKDDSPNFNTFFLPFFESVKDDGPSLQQF